jgi:hypothetical protein
VRHSPPRLVALALTLACGGAASSAASVPDGFARTQHVAWRLDGRAAAIPDHAVAGWRQRVRPLPDGSSEVTVVVGPFSDQGVPREPLPALDARWLELPPVEAQDDDLIDLAGGLASPGMTPAAASAAILEWVGREVVHDPSPSGTETATGVLHARRGSCVGRSLLAVALLRAAGVPARSVHGLLVPRTARVGADVGSAEFTLHRFVETWLPGVGFVPSDPGESIHYVSERHLVLAVEGDAYDAESFRQLVLRPISWAGEPAAWEGWASESGGPRVRPLPDPTPPPGRVAAPAVDEPGDGQATARRLAP